MAYLNVNWAAVLNDYRPPAKRKITVAYIPVTCQLTCPVTDYISKFSQTARCSCRGMFQGFPEIKEALISNKMQAAFIVAPMAIALEGAGRSDQGRVSRAPLRQRRRRPKDGPVKTFADMRGRTVAIPSRFSDERLILFRAMKVWGIKPGEIKMVEMAPPDVSGALAAGAIDAFSMGEPFPSQAEMAGYGRVLFQAREYWPDYMSCILVVRQDLIDTRPDVVQVLVDGIARSGLWLDKGQAPPRRRRRFRGPLLLQPEARAAPMGAHEAAGPRHVQPARSAQSRFRYGARLDDGDGRARTRRSSSASTPIRDFPTGPVFRRHGSMKRERRWPGRRPACAVVRAAEL